MSQIINVLLSFERPLYICPKLVMFYYRLSGTVYSAVVVFLFEAGLWF